MIAIGTNKNELIGVGKDEQAVKELMKDTSTIPFDRVTKLYWYDVETILNYFLQENPDFRIRVNKNNRSLKKIELVKKS